MSSFFDTQTERWVAVPGGPPCPVGLDAFVRHAKKFGVDCVVETATELGLDHRDLRRLRVECDGVEANKRWVGKRRRRSPQETLEAVVALQKESLVPAAIADRLGLTEIHVRRVLKGVADFENPARNPCVHAADSVLEAQAGVTVIPGPVGAA